MYDIFSAIILGVVEGVTEFLPVSSTGHLIIVGKWLTLSPEFSSTFDVVIQLGAILAVVVLFRKRLWPFERLADGSMALSESFGTWKKILVAVVPALVLGFLLGDVIEGALFNSATVAWALVIGGVLLIVSEKVKKRESVASVAVLGYKKALWIGLIQCLALIPGTSRSAATIIGGLFLGLSRSAAVEFSFFLAIPTMVAASSYALLKGGVHMTGHEALVLSVGFVVSFLVAWAVIRLFLRYVETRSLIPFGYYRIIVGIAILAFF